MGAEAWDIGLASRQTGQSGVGGGSSAAASRCTRLVALVLGPLFRQLAQNERSLFAFVASSEPFGFQEFLREQTAQDDPYRHFSRRPFGLKESVLPVLVA